MTSTFEPMPPTADPHEDWSYLPPDHDPLDDEVFVAELCVEVARRNLHERIRRVDEARRVARNAQNVLVAALEEGRTAVTVLEDAIWELAEARS